LPALPPPRSSVHHRPAYNEKNPRLGGAEGFHVK
jgi:hypothetical protein